jgi:uncharacterized protein involved in tolerance to divalent cations
MRSIYRWRDAIEDDREFLLLIKTRASLYIKSRNGFASSIPTKLPK